MFIGMQLSSRSIPSLRQNISYSHSIQLYAIRFNASNNFDMMWIAIISSIFEGSNQCNLSLEQSALIEWVVFKTTFPLCNCEKSRVFFFKFNCNLSPCRLLITCKFHEIDWGGGGKERKTLENIVSNAAAGSDWTANALSVVYLILWQSVQSINKKCHSIKARSIVYPICSRELAV